jgi:hypothetical protein
MPFELVAIEPAMAGGKAVGENILLANLSADYKVYAFYYPGQPPNAALEKQLRALGKDTGKNLLVNIGRFNDPEFDRVVKMFGITKYPVIVMTAVAGLAASQDETLTAYARLDNEHLLASPERTVQCVESLFNQFLQGDVAKAVSSAKWAQRLEVLRVLGGVVGAGLSKVAGLVFDRDISLSFAKIKLELKKKEG